MDYSILKDGENFTFNTGKAIQLYDLRNFGFVDKQFQQLPLSGSKFPE